MTPLLVLMADGSVTAEVAHEPAEDRPSRVALKALPRSAAQRALVVLPTPELTLEQACRLLKVLPTAAWEVIETARRERVARAQPDKLLDLTTASREALQEDARLANLASQKLFEARLGTVSKPGAAATGDGAPG